MEIFSGKKNMSGKDKNPTKEMSFIDHLEELRWTIFRSLLYIIVIATLAFVNKSFIFDKIIFAFLNDDFPTFRFLCLLGEKFCIKAPELVLSTRQMGEQFMVHFKVATILGFVVAFPLIIWEIWKFVSPGLNLKERHGSGRIIIIGGLLFFLGILFGFFIIAPFAIKFFATYTVSDFAQTMPTLDSYVGFLTMLVLPAGLIFELPLVIYFLSKLGIISSGFLKTYRRHAIVIIMILAGVITPPDVLSQILVGIPILLIYEIGIIIARGIEKRRKDA
ncbi:MAG: twin-arginine translocase subunit TatC [Deltaproteobacteria bacterium]